MSRVAYQLNCFLDEFMNSTRVFRLFISSTFSDFIAEREALQKNVFPKLEQYCAERGAQFQAIDLRWGITEQAQREHNTLQICLEEVRRCQQLSPRPNFAVLLGNRYGWEPVPARIPYEHWNRLKSNAKPEHWSLISLSYRLDKNAIPAVYCLNTQSADDDAFQHESQLLESLRQTAAGFRGNERLPYFTSATHQEIVLGALSKRDVDGQNLHPKAHVHVYERHLDGMPRNISAKDFIDWDSSYHQVALGASQRMQKLKTQLRRQLGDHYHDLKSAWSLHGKNSSVNQTYLKQFCDLFLKHQIELIDKEIATLDQIDHRQQRERLHQDFGDERARVFAGRKPLLAKIARYTNQEGPSKSDQTKTKSKQQAPLMLIGGGGSGKSALLARAAQETSQREQRSRTVLLQRYIGGVPGTESLLNTLSLLCADIATDYGNPEPPVTQNAEDLTLTFEVVLGYATAQRPLIVFLDALDQLNPSDGAWTLEWLPNPLPEHVRIVATVRSDTAAEQAARCKFPKKIIDVPRLKLSEGRAILKAWLADKREPWFNAGITPSTGRRLTKEQEQKILSVFDQNGLALWIKIVYQEASAWSSWHKPRDLPINIRDLIHDLVEQKLLAQEMHPRVFTERALAYLTASRFGLSENEIGRALGIDQDVRLEFQDNEKTLLIWDDDQSLPPIMWSRLFFDLRPYLGISEIDGKILMRWFHREFDDVFRGKYLSTIDDRNTIHGVLADVFQTLDHEARPNETSDDAFFKSSDASDKPRSAALRRIMEQPWQLAQAGREEELEQLMSDFGFCMGKCSANRSADLASDMLLNRHLRSINSSDASSRKTAKSFETFVIGQQHLLRRGNDAWPAHRIFLQLASQQSPKSVIRKSCEAWLKNKLDNWLWIKSIDGVSEAPDVLTLEGHKGGFSSFAAAELIGDCLISRHTDYRVWNLNTGKVEAIYQTHERPLVIACSPKRKLDAHRVSKVEGWPDMFWEIGQNEIRFWGRGWGGDSICTALEISDGRIAQRHDDHSIEIVDLFENGLSKLLLTGHLGSILGFAELSDGTFVSWAEDKTLRIWSLDTGSMEAIFDCHGEEVNGILELPDQKLLSWDEGGNFFLTNYKDGNSTYLNDLKSKTAVNDDWCGVVGAITIPDKNPTRFVAWNRDFLGWYNINGQLITKQENNNMQGIAYLDDVGLVRAINSEIIITNDSGEVIAEEEEEEARFISGLLHLDDKRLITWTGYKGGDDTIRVWGAIEDSWDMGIELTKRVETNSQWIYDIFPLSDGRLVSCSEDDNIRVWGVENFEKEQELNQDDTTPQKNINATSLIFIGQGMFVAIDFNYSKANSELVVIDAHTAETRIIEDIEFNSFRVPRIQTLSPELILIDGFCCVDLAQNSIHLFDDAQDIHENHEDRRRKRQFIPLNDRGWLAVSLNSIESQDDKKIVGSEVSYWIRDFSNEFIELGKVTIELAGFKQLLGITDQIFTAFGDDPSIQFWAIDDDEWPFELGIFVNIGSLSPLTTAPEDILALPEAQLAVWNKLGQIAIIAVEETEILSTFEFNSELVSVVLSDQGSLICACSDGTVAFLCMVKGNLSLSHDPIKAAPDIWNVVSYCDNELLTFSKGRVVQRWNIKKREEIYPGTKLSIETDMRKCKGNVLFQGDGDLIYFDDKNQEFYRLESSRERLALRNQMGEILCQWHFTRAGDRELYEPAAITPKGVLMTVAKGQLHKLQLMRSGEVSFDQLHQ